MYHGIYLVLYRNNTLTYSHNTAKYFRGVIYEKLIE